MYVIEFLFVGITLTIILNGTVIVYLIKKKSKINQLDFLLLSLAVSDVLQAVIGYSLEIYGQTHTSTNTWIGCEAAGFSVHFFALVSICHLVGISLDRLVIVKYPVSGRAVISDRKVSLFIIIPCWVYGFVFALPPIVGWGSYKRLKPSDLFCQLDYLEKANNTEAYLWFILFFCYALPMGIIVTCSTLIIMEIRKARKELSTFRIQDIHLKRRRSSEQRLTVTCIIIIVMYMLSWTPYAACVLVLSNDGIASRELVMYSALFAKASTIYNPIIYSLCMYSFRYMWVKFITTPIRRICLNVMISSIRYHLDFNVLLPILRCHNRQEISTDADVQVHVTAL